MEELNNYSLVIPGKKSSALYVSGIDKSVLLLNDFPQFKEEINKSIGTNNLLSLYENRKKSLKVLNVWLYMTLDCDFSCYYCVQAESKFEKGGKMTKEVIQKVANLISSYKNEESEYIEITYFGGEPLINFEMIIYAAENLKSKINIPIIQTLITNGYNLDDNKIKEIDRIGIDKIQITIDGSKPLHDQRRVTKGNLPTYEKIKSNLVKIINATTKTIFIVKVTVDKNNINGIRNFVKDELEIFTNPRVFLDVSKVENVNNGSIDETCLSAEEFSCFYKKITNFIYKLKVNMVPPSSGGCSLCFNNSIFISPDGTLYRCPSMVDDKRYSCGSVDTLKFDMDRFNEYNYLNKNCLECKYFYYCNGGCKFEYIKRHGKLDSSYRNCNIDQIEKDLMSYYQAKYSDILEV